MNKTAIKYLAVSSLIFAGGMLLYYRTALNLSLPLIHYPKNTHSEKTISFELVSNVGSRYHVKVGIVIPCQDDRQRRKINQKLSGIKSDLLTAVDAAEMTRWIHDNDLDSIRAVYLKVVNRHCEKPIDRLYFDKFLYW